MDWGKAKTILIIALILTNSILVVGLIQKESDKKISQDIIDNTIAVLESQNIKLECEIPDEMPRMSVLTVAYDSMDEDFVNSKIASQKEPETTDLSDESAIILAGEFITECNLYTENTYFKKIQQSENKKIVVFGNTYEGIPVEKSYLKCTIYNGKIESVEREWQVPVTLGRTKIEILSAAVSLMKFMSETEEDEAIIIEDISLVYWVESNSFATEEAITDTAYPSWKIVYNHGKMKCINALNQTAETM